MAFRLHAATAVLVILIAGRAFGQTTRPMPTIADQVHHQFSYFAEGLDLSTEQKSRADDLEKKISDTLENDSAKRHSRDFQKQIVSQYSELLTPDQRKKFDEKIAKSEKIRAGILTSGNLHQIALVCIIYASDHHGEFPPDLGSLSVEKIGPDVFLLPDSKTKIPADWVKMDQTAKTDWINKNTDYVFDAGGKDQAKIDGTFVAGYVKPELATDGNWFMYADGSVHAATKEVAEKAIAELKAGHNPPPSLARN